MQSSSSSQQHSVASLDTSSMATAALPHPATMRPRMHRRTPSLSHYQTTDITKHYQINQQILTAFESCHEQKKYSIAYAVGLKFVETALLEIPKHGYYYARRHEQDRMNSALEAVRVSRILQEIQQEQDETNEEQQVRVSKLADLAIHQVQQASEDQYEQQRAETELELQQQEEYESEWIVCEPFLTCHESLSSVLCPPQALPLQSSPIVAPIVASEHPSDEQNEEMIVPESRDLLAEEARDVVLSQDLPSATAVPMNRQSQSLALPKAMWYEEIPLTKAVSEDLMLEKALYLSGLQVSIVPEEEEKQQQEEELVMTKPPFQRQPSRLELETLCDIYHHDFDQLRQTGRIRIGFAGTHQGRLPGSVNGCTVIAPLLCIHHLVEDDKVPDPGLSDQTIVHVIDQETPAILQELRSSLHLSEQAFLIPADAHDYLINNGQLSQDHFDNVIGGNILDDSHVNQFLDLLEKWPSHSKLCATLFFHEHVVAILKLPRDNKTNTSWYDWIDSLPLKDTLAKPSETEEAFNRRFGLSDSEQELSQAFLPMTCRIRCLTADALKATIRWYACSKFTEENHSYIDSYAWDDAQSDFDPRVFQAFVWGDA